MRERGRINDLTIGRSGHLGLRRVPCARPVEMANSFNRQIVKLQPMLPAMMALMPSESSDSTTSSSSAIARTDDRCFATIWRAVS